MWDVLASGQQPPFLLTGPALWMGSWWLAGCCVTPHPCSQGVPRRFGGPHPAWEQPEPPGLVMHPCTGVTVDWDHVARLSSDLGSRHAAPWLFRLSGKTSLQLLRETLAFLFTWFPYGLLSPPFSCPRLPCGLGYIWPCDAGCVPVLCGTPGGGFSQVWVLCCSRETWESAEHGGSMGPWALLSSSVSYNRPGFRSCSVICRALSVVGPWFRRLEFYSAIMF